MLRTHSAWTQMLNTYLEVNYESIRQSRCPPQWCPSWHTSLDSPTFSHQVCNSALLSIIWLEECIVKCLHSAGHSSVLAVIVHSTVLTFGLPPLCTHARWAALSTLTMGKETGTTVQESSATTWWKTLRWSLLQPQGTGTKSAEAPQMTGVVRSWQGRKQKCNKTTRNY